MEMRAEPESTLARVTEQLSRLEKRDWELWVIVSVIGILLGVGLLTVLFPAAFLRQGNVHFEVTVSKHLFVGLAFGLILLNSYLVTRRLELRQLRQKLISSTIQNELVRLQSFTDPLTEVYNRRSLEDLSHRFMSQAKRFQKPLTFLLIDMNRFREVNRRFGHLGGDMVLAEMATLLRSAVRGTDAVIRYGGDEFLVVLADTSRLGADKVKQRIEAYLHDWNQVGHLNNFKVSLSIGVAEWSDGKTLDDVLDTADKNMYAMKAESETLASV